jgi:hypothetical protein
MEVAAGGEDEQGAANRCVQLILADRDLLPRDVREDDKPYVFSRPGTRLRSNRA